MEREDEVETPNQIAHGTGGLLIAVVVTALLATVLMPVLPAAAEGFTGPIAVVTFLVVWWISYLLIVKMVRRRREQRLSEGSGSR